MNFSGEHVIVTGASSGIGLATAQMLAERGAIGAAARSWFRHPEIHRSGAGSDHVRGGPIPTPVTRLRDGFRASRRMAPQVAPHPHPISPSARLAAKGVLKVGAPL